MIVCASCGRAGKAADKLCLRCGETLLRPISGGSVAIKPLPKVNVISPVTYPPSRITHVGMCRYHPELPAFYICSRCGKSLCRDCSKAHLDLILCPQCFNHIMPPPPPVYPAYGAYR